MYLLGFLFLSRQVIVHMETECMMLTSLRLGHWRGSRPTAVPLCIRPSPNLAELDLKQD